ncbi:LOW QUALITY PROTEIN: hypothetical protein PHMEG_00018576 [Phytophthora megakarya]|uniref:Uncharacterized protein n=1 Tax=Phytophthora megakarya TaxID=4795 RepID=A0A225VTG0_9STRA|nr:LOW QUALITY PROTEIN: hypothetical protein PHMEG_00018576 [Phytophthora megakarya]
MSTSRAITNFFFTGCGHGHFSCKECEKNRQLSPGPGYTNLDLATSHSRYGETYGESQRTLDQSFEANGFVD